jgi:hypothetical protein
VSKFDNGRLLNRWPLAHRFEHLRHADRLSRQHGG